MALRDRLISVVRLGFRSKAFARHVYQKVAAITIGPIFVSAPVQRLRAELARRRPPLPVPAIKVAITAHAYYLDLIPEILACRAVLPYDVAVHLTVPVDKVEAATAQLQGVPGITIHPCTNRGRDIAPFVMLLNAGVLDGYDAVLKLHTKRSPHLLDGEARRKLLFLMLCGEREATLKALAAFEEPATGMVGWAACWREAPPYWMANRARVEGIAKRMGASEEAKRLGFFEGSMFWFRPKALAALRELDLTIEDFEAEAGQVDGTLHHALERCFTIAGWSRGFVVRDMKGRLLPGSRTDAGRSGAEVA
jgi:lipopolysaccharide biosynthesis protein